MASPLHARPHVFTIVLNWNQAQLTLDCLESLAASEYRPNTIVVVDNGSTDGSPEQIRACFPEVIVIETGENLGFCEGNNVGIRYALKHGADYLLQLNNDTAVAPDMLTRLVEACDANPTTGMAGPTQYYFDEPQKIFAAGGVFHAQSGRYWPPRNGETEPHPERMPIQPTDYIISCAVLVRREVVEKIGLLDNRFFINGDDIDWGLRVKAAGYQVIYVPAARMWHKVSAAMGVASPASIYYLTRNAFLLFDTHLTGWQRRKALALNFVRTLRTITAWTLIPRYRGFRRQRDANLLALRDAFTGAYGKMGEDVARVCYARPKTIEAAND